MANVTKTAEEREMAEVEKQEVQQEQSFSSLVTKLDEIRTMVGECDKTIANNQAEKERLINEGRSVKEQLDILSSHFNEMFGEGEKPRRRGRPASTEISGDGRSKGGKSVKQHVIEFIESHGGEVTTKEIREYLEKHGRITNPGVELSRMVTEGRLVNKARGIYTLGKKRATA